MSAVVDELTPRPLTPVEWEFYRKMRGRAVASPGHKKDVKVGMPYLAAAIMALRPIALPGLGTFAVDKHGRVYIDFEKAKEWGLAPSTTVLQHETYHMVARHEVRYNALPRKNERYSRQLWNMAADAEINDDLDRQRYKLPEIPYVTPSYIKEELQLRPEECPDGWSAEQYYTLLSRAQEEKEQSEDQDAGQDTEPSKDEVCGGGSGAGAPQPWELPENDKDLPGLSESKKRVIRRTVAEEIRKQITSGEKEAGSIPAGLARWANEELSEPKINWRQRLNSKLQTATKTVSGHQLSTYRRVNRKNPHPTILMPVYLQRVPQVSIRIDTSASMSKEDLKEALEETMGILKIAGSHGDKVDFGSVDTRGYGSVKISSASDIELTGGGGTDMRIAFKDISSRKRPKSDIGIIMTDCATPWPNRNPDPSVKWIVVGIGKWAKISAHQVPSWADLVIVDDD